MNLPFHECIEFFNDIIELFHEYIEFFNDIIELFHKYIELVKGAYPS